MANFVAFMNQTDAPVVTVLCILLSLLLTALIYSALVASARVEEQSEREWAAWNQAHTVNGNCTEGAAYE